VPFVYLLRCADDSLYCGWSTDLSRRVAAHQQGRGGRYTARRLPVRVAAAWETATKTEARSLEGRIKRLNTSQKRSLAAGEPLESVLELKDPVQPVNLRRSPS
jgi:putative endonuclease